MQILHYPRLHPHLHPHSLSSPIFPPSLSLRPHLSILTLSPRRRTTTIICMGGGPRTYPGGVSKWQWKRMQAKKAKQLLQARLARERQIYEMRKRAELKAAIADLERPWEVVQRAAPKSALFSIGVDEQLKVLADRFQKPGGFDLWSEDDGPQLFESPDELPTARFFPKGVVHSIKPYGLVGDGGREVEDEIEGVDGSLDGVGLRNTRGSGNGFRRNSSRGSQGGRLGSGKFGGDSGKSDGDELFHSSVNLNDRNVGILAPGKHRREFRDSGDVDGSVSGVGSRNRRGGRNWMNSSSRTQGSKLGNGSFARETEESSNFSEFRDSGDVGESVSGVGSRNRRGGRNGMNLRSGTQVSKLGNGSFAKEREESRDGSSEFTGSKPMNGSNNKHEHRWSNNRRGGGTKMDGNGLRVKDMGGRKATSSNTRSNARSWSSGGGNVRRFRRSNSEDVYDMSLQRDGSYGFRARADDARVEL